MVWNLCSVDSNCPRMSVSPSGAWGVRLSVLLKSVPGVSTAAACENDSLKAWLRSSCTYCQYQQLDKGLVPNTTKWPKLNHLSMKGWDFSPFLFYVAIQGLGYRAVYFSLDLKTLDKCFRLGQYRQTACEIHGSQPRFLNLWQQREALLAATYIVAAEGGEGDGSLLPPDLPPTDQQYIWPLEQQMGWHKEAFLGGKASPLHHLSWSVNRRKTSTHGCLLI